MKMELSKSMANIVQEVVALTPKEIVNMSNEEIAKHAKVKKKENRLFYKFGLFRIPKRKPIRFSWIQPRGSMIVAHYRFSYKEDTDRKIRRMK